MTIRETKVNQTQRSAPNPSANTGLFATLRALRHPLALGVHRLALSVPVLAMIVGILAVSPAPALAAGPALAGEVATGVTASSADLQATLNPQGLPVTACTFQYGATAAYGSSAPCEPSLQQIGERSLPVPISAQISGLAADTEYHWRVLASSETGSSASPDHTFIYPTTAETLPDNRAYEMVTPPRKDGGLIGALFFGPHPNISEDGSSLMALTIQCFAPAESCTASRPTNGEPYAFNRTPSGWAPTALAPPSSQFLENTPWRINATQGTALFSMPTGPAGEEEWYERSPAGAFVRIGPINPPGGSGDGEYDLLPLQTTTGPEPVVVWNTHLDAQTRWPFDNTAGRETPSLYEEHGTAQRQPFLVGVAGSGEELISTCATSLGNAQLNEEPWHALSADGRTVYFDAWGLRRTSVCSGTASPPVDELFARVDGGEPDARTVAISQPRAPETLADTPADKSCESEACQKNITEVQNWRDARFEGASADGSRVFFTSTQQLTDTATQDPNVEDTATPSEGCAQASGSGGCNLYEFLAPQEHPLSGANWVDVSACGGCAAGPHVLDVVAISEDGSHVYFVANGVLAAGAVPGTCTLATEQGSCNLYVYERDARFPTGRTTFIATLPAADRAARGSQQFPEANTTPDGRFLVFASRGNLTPDASRTDGAQQIYRYDATAERLVRVSAGENGFNDNGNSGTGDASIVRPAEGTARSGPTRADPTMSHDGSYLLFQSPIALTPHALNDVPVAAPEGLKGYAENVYEWHEGHVHLISDGHDAASAHTPCLSRVHSGAELFLSAVCLLGVDASGANAFFTTTDQLVRRDTDTQADIYDARICEPGRGNPCISEPPPGLPPCLGEQCHGIPAATPSGLAPGTATFNGEGNITPTPFAVLKRKPLTNAQKLAKALSACRSSYKHSKRRRRACEKQAHRTHRVTARKATGKRRAGR
jgi:hypothetical protein